MTIPAAASVVVSTETNNNNPFDLNSAWWIRPVSSHTMHVSVHASLRLKRARFPPAGSVSFEFLLLSATAAAAAAYRIAAGNQGSIPEES